MLVDVSVTKVKIIDVIFYDISRMRVSDMSNCMGPV
jgi:hypothetical protein